MENASHLPYLPQEADDRRRLEDAMTSVRAKVLNV